METAYSKIRNPKEEEWNEITASSFVSSSKNKYAESIVRTLPNIESDITQSNFNESFTESKNVFNDREDVITETFSVKSDSDKSIRDLYFNDFISPELRTAVKLLEDSQKYVTQALEYVKAKQLKDSDEYIMEFKQSLPELFCCRNISESFGAIINSIQNALSNMKGQPLSEPKVIALSNIITGLLREPAMSFEKAVDYISDFEDADFEVESVGLEGLLMLLEITDE